LLQLRHVSFGAMNAFLSTSPSEGDFGIAHVLVKTDFIRTYVLYL